MIKIKEIAFTCYPVTDLSRARAFYQNVLGLTPSLTFENEGQAWIEYDIGTATLAITNMGADSWKPSKNGGSVALEVEDFPEAVRSLKEAGATFYGEPMESPACHLAVVGDPDGNTLCLHKRKG